MVICWTHGSRQLGQRPASVLSARLPPVTRTVPAATALVLAALVALTAAVGIPLLVAALLLTTVALATGWPKLLGLPTQRGSTSIMALGGTVAVLAVALTPDEPRMRLLPSVLALSVLAAFVHQLLRRDMRPRLVESVTGVLSGVVVVELSAGWVAVAAADGGLEIVLVATCALAAAALASAVPWPQRYTGPLAVVSGAVFGALAAVFLTGPAPVPAAVLGLAAGSVVACLDRLFLNLPTITSRQAGVCVGAAVVAACGAVVYLAARVLT